MRKFLRAKLRLNAVAEDQSDDNTLWFEGTDQQRGVGVKIMCGAGKGHPFLHVEVSRLGEVVARECLDINPMISVWVESILTENPA